jgi:autotransporter-associated beta strand protein
MKELVMTVTLVSGTGTEADPDILTGSGDISSYVLANKDVQLSGGGAFTIVIPQTAPGTNLVASPADVDPTLDQPSGSRPGSNGFASASDPTIDYTGTISGDGSIEVESGFNTIRSSPGSLFTGGVLVFDNQGQSWGLTGIASGGTNAPALIIDSNVTVAFSQPNTTSSTIAFPTSTTIDRNIENNGYLNSSINNHWANITGSGVSVFQFNDGNGGLSGAGFSYSGQLFDFNNGTQLAAYSTFSPSTVLQSTDITVFHTPGNQFLTNEATLTNASIWNISNNWYNQSLDWQIENRGILQLGGIFLPPGFNPNNLVQVAVNVADLTQYSYGTGVNNGFGKTIYDVDQATMVFGDGQAIIANPLDANGVTNNVFLQGNPANSLLSINNFGGQTGATAEALGLDYSGTYHVNFNLNQNVSFNSDGSLVITGPRNGIAYNFFILNPNDPVFNAAGNAKSPNHVILTVPAFFDGLTRIDNNAILQLGDGTAGDDIVKTISPPSTLLNGEGVPYGTITSRYNDSNGNGALLTRGNTSVFGTYATGADNNPNTVIEQIAANPPSIVDNGEIIVDNTSDARDAVATGTDPGATTLVAAFIQQNELDNISGTGGLLQEGQLALTLEGDTSYSGATTVAASSTLALKANSITGTTGLPNSVLDLAGTSAIFDISQADASNTVAGLTGVAGSTIALGANRLTINSAVKSTFAGSITDGGLAGGAGGSLVKAGAGLLDLSGLSSYTGSTTIESGALEIDAPTFGSSNIDLGNTATLALSGTTSYRGAIQNFGTGNEIVIDNFLASSEQFNAGILTLTSATGTEHLNLTGTFTGGHFSALEQNGDTIVEFVICYLRGTRIATPAGEIRIEDLKPGDAIVTRFNGYQKLKWVGRQSYGHHFIKNNRDQMPVLIEASALAPDVPKRDLYVSPGHSMLLAGILVLAKDLINGETIRQIQPREDVHYYNLEFETHDCVMADGAWSESYADAPGMRSKFHNAAEFYTLYPHDTPPTALILCAPRPTSGPFLHNILTLVAARASARIVS